jgi:hypothetical protein
VERGSAIYDRVYLRERALPGNVPFQAVIVQIRPAAGPGKHRRRGLNHVMLIQTWE